MHAAIRAYLVDEYLVDTHSQTYTALERLVPGNGNPADVILAVKYYDDTLEDVRSRGADLVITPIAKEGFVFLVHADNPVDGLTQRQLRDIYAGKITNWKELGGNDEVIEPFTRNWDSGSQTAMEDFMNGVPIAEGLSFSVGSMGDLISAIHTTGSTAIGFSIYSWLVEQRAFEVGLKILAVDGVAPSNDTLSNDRYPLRVYTYSYYNSGNTLGKNLTDWLLTAEGQKVIASAGYVGLFGELPPDEQLDFSRLNRDDNDAQQVIYEFYVKHKLISSPDGTIRRGIFSIERLTDRAQTETMANGKGKALTVLYLFSADGTFDVPKDGWVYQFARFIVLTREKGGAFEVINEGEVLSFENGVITTSETDSHIERFPIEADYYTQTSLDEYPDAFQGYIPDFEALGFVVTDGNSRGVKGILDLKNGVPYLLQFFIESSGHHVWYISTDPDYFEFVHIESSGELKELTEQIVFDAINNQSTIKFAWDDVYFAVQVTAPQDVWAIIQHMALSAQ